MARDDQKKSGKRAGKSKEHKVSFTKPVKDKPEVAKPKVKKGQDEIRLNKYIANSGMCSRREADVYISAGAVQVNGKTVTEMGYKVKLTDEVKFDGRRINPEPKEYVLLNKPKGFDCALKEELAGKSALGLVANASKYNLLPVGKLDRNTTGLLLFTNDTDMLKKLTSTGRLIRKIFHVTLDQNLKFEDFQKIEEGVYIAGNKVKIEEISYLENAPKNEIGLKIFSNKNQIVRKLFSQLGYEVLKLDRVAYAGLTKKDLPRGSWKRLSEQEVNNLRML